MVNHSLSGKLGKATEQTRDAQSKTAADGIPDVDRAGQSLDRLIMPTIDMPWPAACHPQVERLEQSMIAWGEQHDLIPTAAFRERLERTRFAWLAARCYPRADAVLAQFTADYIGWFFVVDDLTFDRIDSPHRPAATMRALTAMLNVIDLGQHTRQRPIFGESAWLDLCHRLRAYLTSEEHYQRWATGMRLWITALAMQVLTHQHDASVGSDGYVPVRRYTGGMIPVLAIEDAANAGPMTHEEWHRPEVDRLRLNTNNIVCWTNDVHSVQIEARQPGQCRNLVTVLRDSVPGRSWQEAVDLAAEYIRAEITAFTELAEQVRRTASPQLGGWIDGCQDWMTGNLAWTVRDTGRYAHIDQDADDRAIVRTLST